MILQGEIEKQHHIYYEFERGKEPIGAGGMGTVYRGRMVDEKTGAFREVAVKEIEPEGDYSERQTILDRARREASIQLRNDDLVEMLGFVETTEKKLGIEKTRYYVISEFLDGVTLDKVLSGVYADYKGETVDYARELAANYGKDREGTATLIIKHVLSAITALHDNGYLHRDIDPSNIMITSDGKMKLIDFGIAKKQNSLDQSDMMQSKSGAFVGKVEYAAPELVEGKITEQNFTTDIYAAGVLFYQLLTGHLPFAGNRFDIMKGQLNGKPDFSKIRSKKYRVIVEKAMSKKQANRFVSASAMRAALDEEVQSSSKWPYVAVVAAVALAAIIIALVWPKSGPVPDPVEVFTENAFTDSQDTILITYSVDKRGQKTELKRDTLFVAKQKKFDEILSQPMDDIWDMLLSEVNRYNPAALYAAALYYKRHDVDSKANKYWTSVIVPEETAKYLKKTNTNSISARRIEYILLCMAYDHIDKSVWSDADSKVVEIEGKIKEMYSSFSEHFKLPAELQ
ncbi:MAG: serine/threonine protein kinase [Bacteroidales bacterium]|nr:serine/threonine protein kinase [Bacteroidales bacterium]